MKDRYSLKKQKKGTGAGTFQKCLRLGKRYEKKRKTFDNNAYNRNALWL